MDLKRWFKFCLIEVVLLFCINGALSQYTCVPGMAFPGYTVPSGDIAIEYGNHLDITCVLYNNTKLGPDASRFLTFSRNNETIPSEMIKIVNSTAIKLHIDKPKKVIHDNYVCLNDSIPVCMNLVSVGTKPQPVTDFDCISYNFDNLTCSWTAPQNYVQTNYNLTYRLRGRSARYNYSCPVSPETPLRTSPNQRMSCFWNVSTTPNYRQVHEEFDFFLEMYNVFGTTRINKTFVHFAHVLSGPPENLTWISTTPSSIFLAWTVPTSMQTFPPGVHHRILYQCEYGEKTWHFGGEIKSNPQAKHATFNLTDLKYAHALCDIRVSLRSAKAAVNDESMWSRNASITVRTSSKIPDAPPKTDIGSFEVVACSKDLQCREAYIYWQQIRQEEQNGPDFGYDIEVEGNPLLRPVELNSAYATFKNLSISTSYTFHIWSRNANGSSQRRSTVYIPKQIDRIKEPLSFTKVEYGDGRFELTWEPPKLLSNQYLTNYTIFWCSNERDRPYQCNGKLNWTVVSNDTLVYNGTVAKNKIFQFAISANTENGSSGMLWAACTVIHNKNMGKMKNVWINRLGSTFIEVGWKLDCADRIGSVRGFIIYYCPIISPMQTDCKDPQKNVTFMGDGTVLGGNITDLEPYTTYMLTVAVITKHTTISQQSDPLYNTTLEAAPKPPRELKVTDVTNSTMSLLWRTPEAINGILKFYKVEVWVSGDKYPIKSNTVDPTNGYTCSYTVTDLDSYKKYIVSVEACTIACSEKAITNATTRMGYPGEISKPTVDRRNDTSITIAWNQPHQPNGEINYYIVQFKQIHNAENKTVEVNVTDRKYVIPNCGDGGKYNTFYVSVSAVNIINNTHYQGPRSDELENYCDTPINYIMYILSVVVIVFFIAMAFLFNRLYKHCKIMRDVEVKLPPGLAPVVADHTLVPWSTEKHQENRDSRSPPDEELLLVKMSEGRHLSGDSSGCSSGHESVTSSLESGTHISSSSDSGTEQPGSYCVLGVDPKADSSYVPVNADSNKVPYKTCEVSTDSSPYVMTGDPVKTINPGYIPFNQTEPIKSSGYVVAGINNGYYN